MTHLEPYLERIVALCREYRVSSLKVFGSVLDDRRFNSASDIDLVVAMDEMDPFIYWDQYMGLYNALVALFERPVDLLEDRANLLPSTREVLEDTAVSIYESRSTQAA